MHQGELEFINALAELAGSVERVRGHLCARSADSQPAPQATDTKPAGDWGITALSNRLSNNKEGSYQIQIQPQVLLDFDGGIEPVRAEQLIRIIANAAMNAQRLRSYVSETVTGRKSNVSTAAAARYAATLADSLDSLSKLIGGENYIRTTSEWRKTLTSEDTPELSPLDKAFIYERLKRVEERLGANGSPWDRCDEATTMIRELMNEIANEPKPNAK